MRAVARGILCSLVLASIDAGAAAKASEPEGTTAAAASADLVPELSPAGPGSTPDASVELIAHPTFSAAGTVEAQGRAMPLAGVAPTSADLQCGTGSEAWPCGRTARTALRLFVRGRTLECRALAETPASTTAAKRCAVGGKDLGEWMVERGWAAADGPAYAEAEERAKGEKRGIWSPNRSGPFQSLMASQTVGSGLALNVPDTALRAEVELSTQSMTVFHRGEVIGPWPVSTAREGKETPTGVWTAQWLSRDHRSSLYNGAPMPYAIFFEGDYAIHGTYQTARLGQPASHGCVRLSTRNAKLLFDLVSREGVGQMMVVIRP